MNRKDESANTASDYSKHINSEKSQPTFGAYKSYYFMNQMFTKQNLVGALFSVLMIVSTGIFAQCPNNGTFWSDLTPIGVGLTNAASTVCAYGGEYYTVSVTTGNTYNFNTCGSTYDTQLTLRNNVTGALLGYDDDSSPCGSGASDLTWTATFTGVVRVQVNLFSCLVLEECIPLEVVLVSLAGAGCDDGYIGLTQSLCQNGNPTFTITFTGGGDCGFNNVFVSENGAPYVTLPISASNGDAIDITGTLANSTYTVYAQLTDGSFTNTQTIALTNCGGFNAQPVYIVVSPDCYGGEISWNLLNQSGALIYSVSQGAIPFGATTEVSYVTALYLEPGCYSLQMLDSYGDGLNPVGTTCTLVGAYGVVDQNLQLLVDGNPNYTTSATNSFCIGAVQSCTVTGESSSFVECVNGLATMEMIVEFTAGCTISSVWVDEGEGYVEIPFGFTVESGVAYDLTGLLPNNLITYYYEFSDGTTSIEYFIVTPPCAVVQCGNASLAFEAGECISVGAATYASVNFTFSSTGDCIVESMYYSTDGGNTYGSLDVTAEGYVNGSSDLYYLTPGVTYNIYYVLSNGELSNEITIETDDCGVGGTICDCAGTELPAAAMAWLGDGFLDDGSFLWNDEIPVDFNCAVWGFDCGDDGSGVILDLFGTCNGNLPPGNGCIEIPCENQVQVEVAIDCWPGETAIEVLDAEGNIIYAFDETFFSEEYSMVNQTLCLSDGCYTFTIYDTAADGLSSPTCDFEGYFTITGTEGVLVEGGGDFGALFTQEFCVGSGVSCSNLTLSASQAACYDNGEGMLMPSVELTIDYDGECEVSTIYIAENGEFTVFEQEPGVTAESVVTYFNFQPNTTYQFFYVLSDGSVSSLVTYTTGDCDNEITICDCEGTSHSIGVMAWLGDGFADVGEYEWVGQPVNFNCATWGYDCGDIAGSPSLDVYGVCSGNLPPNNGCIEEVLGCTDPTALNYNPDATINNGSCVYSTQFGCTDPEACNYSATAQFDNGGCEYITCAGCTDPTATNYNPSATIDNGTCFYEVIFGCTDPTAVNYNPVATEDDGSCIEDCDLPTVEFEEHCVEGEDETYMVTVVVSSIGNAGPYIVTNTFDQTQYSIGFNGTIELGPFPNNEDVIVTMVSVLSNQCVVVSPILSYECPEINPGVFDSEEQNFALYPNPTNGIVTLKNGSTSNRMNVRVLSQTGQVVFTELVILSEGATRMLDLSGLAAGTYHVEVLTSDTLEHHQLIIQK